jgi:Immunity protein Imm1
MLSDQQQGEHQMIIAGHWNNRMMVNLTTNNLDFSSLVDHSGSQHEQILLVGGQNGDYEERKCVPTEWALAAAQAFYETGELKQSLNWESDYKLYASTKREVKRSKIKSTKTQNEEDQANEMAFLFRQLGVPTFQRGQPRKLSSHQDLHKLALS